MIITNTSEQFKKLKNIMVKRQKPFPFSYVFVLYLMHIALAFGMQYSEKIATAHALITFFIAIALSFVSSRKIMTVYCIAYLCGGETLWRMTEANVFWEFSKYSIILICLRGALEQTFRKFPTIVIYFLLLIPSINVTMLSHESLDQIRQLIAFNLSGPLALTVCALYLYRSKLYSSEFHNVFVICIAPILTMSTLVVIRYAATDEFVFTLNSSFKTSGGFGPNQVSALLGLGSFLALCHVIEGKKSVIQKTLFYFLAAGLFVQSAFTFSRGGVMCAFGAAVVYIICLVSNKKTMGMMIITLGLLYACMHYVALPALNNITDGMMMKRLTHKTLTGRDVLFKDDLRLWKENPILGVGPGMSKKHRDRDKITGAVTAHTEFSRVVAEHGLLGLLALFMLFGFCLRVALKSNTMTMRAYCYAFLCWGFLFMLINAMRLVAPCFMIGLATTWMAADKKLVYVKKLTDGKIKKTQKPPKKK